MDTREWRARRFSIPTARHPFPQHASRLSPPHGLAGGWDGAGVEVEAGADGRDSVQPARQLKRRSFCKERR